MKLTKQSHFSERNMYTRIPVIGFMMIIAWCFTSAAQTLAVIEVNSPRKRKSFDLPLSTSLDNIIFLPDSVMSLFEIRNGKRAPVDMQIGNRRRRILYWIMNGDARASEKRIFELVRTIPSKYPDPAGVQVRTNDGIL